jgi:hypothetical protein
VLTRPNPINNEVETAINTAKRKFFFIVVLWLCYRLQVTYRGRKADDPAGCASHGCKSIQKRVDLVSSQTLAGSESYARQDAVERVLVAGSLDPRRFHGLSQSAAHGTQRKCGHFQFRFNGKIRGFTWEFAATIQL